MNDATDTALANIARAPRLLIALDFDGTLSPHVADPMASRMLPVARAALERLAALPDTAIALVSGRSLDDLRIIAEHEDDSPYYLRGSHGAEAWAPGVGAQPRDDDPAELALRDRLRRRAEELVARYDGVFIEPKAFGFAVHTRSAARAEEAAAADAAVDALLAAEAPHWRRRTGKFLVEYAFREEGKNHAVDALRAELGADAVLFAGDDVTDEDALRHLRPGDLGVRVGDGDTAAAVRVDDIPALADLLERVATERAARAE
jgi:trehalose 6-phosphate phosphatase